MPDIEKVIKALECRKNAGNRYRNPCAETGMCHYATAIHDINGEIYRPFICDRERICTDALALLKEQEELLRKLQKDKDKLCLEVSEWKHKYHDRPLKEQEAVEPTLIREGRNKNYNDYVCPRCDNEVVYEQNYCSECGIPFLWEGR